MYTCHRPTLLRLLCIFKTHVLHYLYNSKLLILTWHLIPCLLCLSLNGIQKITYNVLNALHFHFLCEFIWEWALSIKSWSFANEFSQKRSFSRQLWFWNVKLKRSYDYKHKYFKLAGDIRFQMHFADIL